MKQKLSLKTTALFACFGLGALLCPAQSVPNLINYQGRLTDQTGAALPAAIYSIQFRIWDDAKATNGNDLVWAEQQDVTVASNGMFNVILGSGTQIAGVSTLATNLTGAFTSSNRYFGLTVVSSNGVPIPTPPEIRPRQQIMSTPFAVSSSQAAVAFHALDGTPPGAILAFGGTTAPSGFLLCDGGSYNISDYPNLYSAIGIVWGSGALPGTTFQVPDLRSKFPLGAGQGGLQGVPLSSRSLAQTGGEENHKLTILEMPSHTHNYSGAYGTGTSGRGPDGASPSTATTSAGGDQPHNTMPPYAVVNYIIKY